MSRRILSSWILCLLLWARAAVAIPDPDATEFSSEREYQQKAACLFHLAQFVQWPAHKFAQPDAPLIIGIVGIDPFGGLLEEQVQDRRINDHIVKVEHISTPQEMKRCHILFVSRSEGAKVGNILGSVRGYNVLTVSDMERFIESDGMIKIIMINDGVRLQINKRHGDLNISSRLQPLTVPNKK